MVNKGFPSFGTTQDGAYVSTLRNYNIPEFILRIIADECDSNLLEKGRMDDRLRSMNEEALKMLYRVFVDCEEGPEGRFADYRFYVYVSSAFHKCEVMVNETIPGESQKNHKFPIVVKNNGMYIAVAQNKSTGNPISRREVTRFCGIVEDVKRGEHGTMISEAVYGSSVGIKPEAIEEMRRISAEHPRDGEDHIDFRMASFDNNIYTVTKC